VTLSEYADCDATDLLSSLKMHKTTLSEILVCAYEAIHAFNPRLNAVVNIFSSPCEVRGRIVHWQASE
jgi:Asp-tRNA(Asn)/Glu-tRNA(Gln) amidotransferase A subunit family amidase